MGKREQRKDDNRTLIIEVAQKLMRARNSSGFSMRTLAEVAGVSIATPYNLFGSKQAIIAAVMDTDLDEFNDLLMAESHDPLDIFFHCVTVSVQMFEKEPGFYKAGAQAIQTDADVELATRFGLPRHALLRNLTLEAIQKGYLVQQVNPDSLAVALGQQFFGWITAWAKGQISLTDLQSRTHYGFALTLAAVAMEEHRARLTERMIAVQSALPESWQNRPSVERTAS